MRESLNEPVSVVMYYSAAQRQVRPYVVTWRGCEYRLGKVDFWHKTTHGTVTMHHFSLADRSASVYFKLALNSSNLQWVVEEFMTGDQMEVHYERPGA